MRTQLLSSQQTHTQIHERAKACACQTVKTRSNSTATSNLKCPLILNVSTHYICIIPCCALIARGWSEFCAQLRHAVRFDKKITYTDNCWRRASVAVALMLYTQINNRPCIIVQFLCCAFVIILSSPVSVCVNATGAVLVRPIHWLVTWQVDSNYDDPPQQQAIDARIYAKILLISRHILFNGSTICHGVERRWMRIHERPIMDKYFCNFDSACALNSW